MANPKPFHKLTSDELHQAEAIAATFLRESAPEVGAAFRAKTAILLALIEAIERPETSFEGRIEVLARMAEAAQLIEADALEFFDLATGAVVARLIRSIPNGKP